MTRFTASRRDAVSSIAAQFFRPILLAIVPVVLTPFWMPSARAQPFGQPLGQPHVNAPVEKQVTWQILHAMPNHLKQTLPLTVRNLRNACSGWGGVKLQSAQNVAQNMAQNVDGTVICVQDQQSSVSYSAYRNFGTDYVAASILVSLHTAIQIEPDRRSQLIADFQQPKSFQRLVNQAINQSIRGGSPMPLSTRETLSNNVTRVVTTALKDPNWESSIYGSRTDYDVLSQSFCYAQGLSQRQAQIAATQLQGYQLYATCWMESGLPSQLIRDLRIAKYMSNPQTSPSPNLQPPTIAPVPESSARATAKPVAKPVAKSAVKTRR